MSRAVFALLSSITILAPLWAAEPPDVHVLGSGPGGYLGVQIREVTPGDVEELGLPGERGVIITRVRDDGPAMQAGVMAGDVVLQYQGVTVLNVRQFQRMVGETHPGRRVDMEVWRSGRTVGLTAEIEQRAGLRWGVPGRIEIPRLPDLDFYVDPESHGQGIFVHGRGTILGISGVPLGEQMAEFLGLSGRKGVLVLEVVESFPAADAGLKAGDVITKADGEPVGDLQSLKSHLSGREVTLEVLRQGTALTLRVVLKEANSSGRDAVRL